MRNLIVIFCLAITLAMSGEVKSQQGYGRIVCVDTFDTPKPSKVNYLHIPKHLSNEKVIVKNYPILIRIIIPGDIELDGHIFKNDTSKEPIWYEANIDGVKIYNPISGKEYDHRLCSKPNCKVIHLVDKYYISLRSYPSFKLYNNGYINAVDTLVYKFKY